ncbi:vWA domain-containing protein [Nocardia bovistercoris]|uniref:VWA domain-containing protein n=1 Tax=Nocardia bovistercoris TaxID=2785916 RepID=A0A931IDS0_9NOCA|nr:vWA domain-containing protein [Nocardia bovistercoris]MBH0779321.1 VWA domain-containing protein [Nocardia bovistercoris]
MGYFNGGRFNLTVSLRYTPRAGELEFLFDLFNRTSRLLHGATDGVHSIGTVLFATDGFGGADASIWLHPRSRFWPDSGAARLWLPAESLDTSQDYLMWPTVLVHELSHYLYDLLDEYNNSSWCQGDIKTRASIMETYPWEGQTRWTDAKEKDYHLSFEQFLRDYNDGTAIFREGEPTRYCHAGNHNTDVHNNQNDCHGLQSCWTYMAADNNHNNIAYGLTEPKADGLESNLTPADVACTILIPAQRFELVLDRSLAMAGTTLEQLKIGAKFWIDYVNPLEELGMVTFADEATIDIARSAVPAAEEEAAAWRRDRHAVIDRLAADGGQFGIVAALLQAVNEITARGRAASQVMVLFTNGRRNVGVGTVEQILPELLARGVRVYTIGIGAEQDSVMLESVATTTGARYFPISADLTPEQAEKAILAAMVQIAGESRENGGVVAFDDIDGAGAPIDRGAPFFRGSNRGFGEPDPRRPLRFPVNLSEGSVHATLGALWNSGYRSVRQVRIYDPDGSEVAPGRGVRYVEGIDAYAFYEVSTPMPGIWHVEVLGEISGDSGLRSLGLEVNPDIRLEATAIPHHPARGETFRIRARLLSPHPVPHATILARIHSPEGVWTEARLVRGEQSAAEKGLYIADVPTDEDRPGQYLIVIDANVESGTFVQEIDDLYTMHADFEPGQRTRTVATPDVRRRAILSVVTTERTPSPDEPIPGSNSVDPVIPEDHDDYLRRCPSSRRSSCPPPPSSS